MFSLQFNDLQANNLFAKQTNLKQTALLLRDKENWDLPIWHLRKAIENQSYKLLWNKKSFADFYDSTVNNNDFPKWKKLIWTEGYANMSITEIYILNLWRTTVKAGLISNHLNPCIFNVSCI